MNKSMKTRVTPITLTKKGEDDGPDTRGEGKGQDKESPKKA
jgi:hypothetical protein